MRPRVFGAVAGLLLAACTAIPPLQEDGVAISDIVQRVKCELAYAVPDLRGTYPSGDFQWIKYWTARVDLTLDVNDQSSLKPNTNYVTPLPQVTLPGGVFSRFWNIAAGGELSAQAQRTEKLSFTLSIKELMESRHSALCDLPEQMGLLGNLGLKEWVSSALVPASNKQLTIGFHQPPVGKTATTPLAGPSVIEKTLLPEPPARVLLRQAQAAVKAAEKGTQFATTSAATARDAARKARVQQTYNAVDKTYAYIEAANLQIDLAQQFAWQAGIADREAATGDKLSDAEGKLLTRVGTDIKAASDLLIKAKQTAGAAWDLLPHDSPLDSITHTAKFIVTTGANVTPNWQLVRFRGPGLTAPFASASRVRTNTLDVVLGAPSAAGGKALSDEQQRQLFNLQLDALRQSLVPLVTGQ